MIKIYRSMVDNQEYRVKRGVVEYRCFATGQWFPSTRTEFDLKPHCVSYTIHQEEWYDRWLRKASTVTRRICARIVAVVRHV